jgi:AcrR family transcriptional regulator
VLPASQSGGPSSPRAYSSPRRQAAARATRRAILDAALDLFSSAGYAATTREAIAARAGVAVQTVAAVFGTKRAILDALLDEATRGDGGAPSPAMRSWLQDLRDQPDPAAVLRHHAGSSTRVSARLAAVAEVVRRAAAADPEIASAWESLQQQRLRGQATVVEVLAGRGPLHTALSRVEAADLLWVLTDDALYHGLVVERGWRPERFEAWLGEAMCTLLLG